jgi:hypothetical protein
LKFSNPRLLGDEPPDAHHKDHRMQVA